MVSNYFVFLERFSYSCNCYNLRSPFRRHVPKLCVVCDFILNFAYDNCINFLFDFEQPWLSPYALKRCSIVVYIFISLVITLFNAGTLK